MIWMPYYNSCKRSVIFQLCVHCGIGFFLSLCSHQTRNSAPYFLSPPTLCRFRKYPYSPHRRLFVLHTPIPRGNSSLASYFSSKVLAFMTPLPLGISNDLPWGGYGLFQSTVNELIQEMNVLLS